MSGRWKWDFEDEQAARRAPSPRPLGVGPAHGGPASLAQLRRRRTGAALVALVVVIVLAVLLAGSHHGARPRTSSAAAGAAARAAAKTGPPSDPEADASAAVGRVLAYTPFVREGGGDARDIALTFDDGPGPYTPEVLSVLERFNARATFFAIGKMERYFSVSTIREIRDHDEVGDHTESHPMLAHLSAHDQYEELFEQIARIELLGGRRPVLFRPPYGSFNATTLRELRSLHLLMVLWSADTEDYLQPGVATIVQRALAGAHPGAIILMHDGGGNRAQTIAALPTIITRLRAQGYRLVTVSQLLLDDPPPAGLPLPPNLSGD
jgi:peptidoglycan/xylan/chitin deacetylase (PgdA/CDA1 family)